MFVEVSTFQGTTRDWLGCEEIVPERTDGEVN